MAAVAETVRTSLAFCEHANASFISSSSGLIDDPKYTTPL